MLHFFLKWKVQIIIIILLYNYGTNKNMSGVQDL